MCHRLSSLSNKIDHLDILFSLLQDGQTALHLAASAGHAETVSALILGGCDIGIQDFVSIQTGGWGHDAVSLFAPRLVVVAILINPDSHFRAATLRYKKQRPKVTWTS